MNGRNLLLIHPPVVKPSEPPAGIARLAGALKRHGARCEVIDANIDGLHHLLGHLPWSDDTWTRRARRHRKDHVTSLRSAPLYGKPDAYRRAVADINRLLSFAGRDAGIRMGLSDYTDKRLSPARSADLMAAAEDPERNPFFDYFNTVLWPQIEALNPFVVGVSINFLSQALCAFALIGLMRRKSSRLKIIIGGGLVTSWLQHPRWPNQFKSVADHMVTGAGERVLMRIMGIEERYRHFRPDYSDLQGRYLSPGYVLPFSASDGCWWRRCAFCPERAEQRPFRPLPRSVAIDQLQQLVDRWRPSMVHLLDNALSPSLLKALASQSPGAPWYGFTRIGPPLDDPDFCLQLAASGCRMLKLGLESGDQAVLDALGKGVRLETAVRILGNLKKAGIATYIYLLFGTPAEDEAAARRTTDFVVRHSDAIGFLNLAIFNLPIHSPDAEELELEDFYPGDLGLYKDFKHPRGWHRSAVRRFINKQFKKRPAVQTILRRNPPVFTSNHAAFFANSIIGNGQDR